MEFHSDHKTIKRKKELLNVPSFKRGILELRSVSPYLKKPEIFSPGGYTVEVQGRSISFDWDCSNSSFSFSKDGHLVMTSYLREESPDFDHDYLEIGLDPAKITGELLTSGTLTEVLFLCCEDSHEERHIPMLVTSFAIEDHNYTNDSIQTYAFSQQQLDAYNAKIIGQ